MTLPELFKYNQQKIREQNRARQYIEKKQNTKELVLMIIITVLLFLVLILAFKSFCTQQEVAIENCINNGNNVDYCVNGVV